MAVHGSFAEARMTAGRPFGGEGLERTGKQSRKGFRLQDSHLVHDPRKSGYRPKTAVTHCQTEKYVQCTGHQKVSAPQLGF